MAHLQTHLPLLQTFHCRLARSLVAPLALTDVIGADDVEVYVNSLLATLNARAVTIKHLLENQESSPAPPISTDMEFATMNTQLTSSPDKVRCDCRNYNAEVSYYQATTVWKG